MSAQAPSEGQPPPKNKGLTPVQIGAGVGAAVTCLFLLVVQDLSRQVAPQGGAEGGSSNFLFGVWCAIGAMAGMAIVALVSRLRRRKTKADTRNPPADDAGAQTTAAVHPAPPPEAKAERNGSPIFRTAAGAMALGIAGVSALVASQGRLAFLNLVLMTALGFVCAWYAVRGRKGLPRFLTKRQDA